MQERCNSSALAMELYLSYPNHWYAFSIICQTTTRVWPSDCRKLIIMKKMAANLQMTYSKCICSNEKYYIWLKFHWSSLLVVQLTISHDWFSWWHRTGQATNHYLMALCSVTYKVQCRYNTVNFLPNSPKIHPISHLLGWGMGCILWVQTLIYTLPQSLQWCMQYHVILDCIITAPDCMHYYASMSYNVIRTCWAVIYFDMLLCMIESIVHIVWHIDNCLLPTVKPLI